MRGVPTATARARMSHRDQGVTDRTRFDRKCLNADADLGGRSAVGGVLDQYPPRHRL